MASLSEPEAVWEVRASGPLRTRFTKAESATEEGSVVTTLMWWGGGDGGAGTVTLGCGWWPRGAGAGSAQPLLVQRSHRFCRSCSGQPERLRVRAGLRRTRRAARALPVQLPPQGDQLLPQVLRLPALPAGPCANALSLSSARCRLGDDTPSSWTKRLSCVFCCGSLVPPAPGRKMDSADC